MTDKPANDDEQNRLSARAARYVRVSGNIGTIAAKVAGQRLFGLERNNTQMAGELAAALGGLKGPIMKVAHGRLLHRYNRKWWRQQSCVR